jgi:hypothetical protein
MQFHKTGDYGIIFFNTALMIEMAGHIDTETEINKNFCLKNAFQFHWLTQWRSVHSLVVADALVPKACLLLFNFKKIFGSWSNMLVAYSTVSSLFSRSHLLSSQCFPSIVFEILRKACLACMSFVHWHICHAFPTVGHSLWIVAQ